MIVRAAAGRRDAGGGRRIEDEVLKVTSPDEMDRKQAPFGSPMTIARQNNRCHHLNSLYNPLCSHLVPCLVFYGVSCRLNRFPQIMTSHVISLQSSYHATKTMVNTHKKNKSMLQSVFIDWSCTLTHPARPPQQICCPVSIRFKG